ncbi:MAG: CoA transferase [Ilumatobacteraceae bacterium]|nr:CoA transferase [Ilumatobacteraceae bacterium]
MTQRDTTPADGKDQRPCSGIRIVDLTQGMAGPMATMVLADHGADVVKVEPPGGDWARAHLRGFHMWNRGKRSVELDLSNGSDRADLVALVARADVVVTDSWTTSTELEHESLIGANPRIVHCHISAWGGVRDEHGPDYEATVAAASGQFIGLDLLSGQVLHPSRPDPTFSLPPTASYGAAMIAVQALLAALLGRHDDQPGEYIETSLFHGSMAFLMRQELARPVPPRSTTEPDLTHRGIELSFLTAECADGRYIQMCARQDHHFRSWLRVLDVEHLLDDDRFSGAPMGIASLAAADELEAILRDRMRTRSQAEWMSIFVRDRDIGADPFLTPEEFLTHDQMVLNHRIVDVDDPELGLSTQIGSLLTIDGAAPSTMPPAPRLGQHGAEIRSELAARSGEVAAPIGSSTPGARRPLEGVTILEVAYFIAGPLAATLLAELGARVIKVEPLAGDPYRRTGLQSAKYLHGKESIALDLKHPDGQAVLHELIAECDVLVHSFRSGVPERLKMDEATARAINPDLIYLNAASYGSHGPESGRVAFHSTPTALSGAGIAQAGTGNAPVDDSFPDPAAGLGAATALMIALHHRSRVAGGCSIETTMLTSAGYVMSNDLVMVAGNAHQRIADHEQLGVCATYRLYPCADGWTFLAIVTEQEWRRFVEAVDDPAIRDDPRFGTLDDRRRHDGALTEAIGRVLLEQDASSWEKTLTAHDVVGATVDFSGFESWLEQHGVAIPAEHPAFRDYYHLPPKSMFAQRPLTVGPACAIGEHTTRILHELGHSDVEIAALLDNGAVQQWENESP